MDGKAGGPCDPWIIIIDITDDENTFTVEANALFKNIVRILNNIKKQDMADQQSQQLAETQQEKLTDSYGATKEEVALVNRLFNTLINQMVHTADIVNGVDQRFQTSLVQLRKIIDEVAMFRKITCPSPSNL